MPLPPSTRTRSPVRRRVGGAAAADHGRDAQLAGDDGRVGERRAHVGNDRGGAGKDGRPADVGRHRHQDLARLELVALLRPVQHADLALDAACRAGKTGDRV